jgi:hypothetical protein
MTFQEDTASFKDRTAGSESERDAGREERHRTISRSTIAAAARVIAYAAARAIVLSAGLISPSKTAADGVEEGNAQDGSARTH